MDGYSSSFFPKNMSPQEVIDSINEAYIEKKKIVEENEKTVARNIVKKDRGIAI